jgi:hypothetical protein
MKRILFVCSVLFFMSACSTTSTGKGLSAFNDNRSFDAIPHLKEGVEEGDKMASMLLALIYLSDAQVPTDIDKASFYYEKLKASDGNIYDQHIDYYLDYIQASIFLMDDNVINDSEGVKLLRQSKYLNYSPALVLLAKSYSTGKGVNTNYRLAHKLFLRSIEYGDRAQTSLGYAWVLAVHEDDGFRQGANPIDFIPDINDINEDYLFIYYDTLAAIKGRMGQFEEAVRLQNLAVELVKKEAMNNSSYQTWVDDYSVQLNAFYNKEPATVPLF